MPSSIGNRLVSLLDWCWPFPLGVIAASLAFVIAAGTWLVFRDQRHTAVGKPAVQSGAPELPVPHESTAEGLPNSTDPLPVTPQPVESVGESGSATMTTGRSADGTTPADRVAMSSTSRRISAESGTSSGAALVRPRAERPKPRLVPSAPKLSAVQQADISDRLKIGRFLMGRNDFRAAIKEFQAALAIDPSNREVRSAIEQAQEASKTQDSSPQP